MPLLSSIRFDEVTMRVGCKSIMAFVGREIRSFGTARALEQLSFCGFIAEELLDHNQTVATEFNLTLELGLQIFSCRTIVQNVNAVNPPSRRREALLKVKLLPGRLYGYMTPVYFHSVLLDCDGVSGLSSSTCYNLWKFFRQMSTRILWALETTPELLYHLP